MGGICQLGQVQLYVYSALVTSRRRLSSPDICSMQAAATQFIANLWATPLSLIGIWAAHNQDYISNTMYGYY